MNTQWLKISKDRRIEILNQISNTTGLPAIAIEKDWWVTLALNASFSLEYSHNIIFKGGTSLSKGWNLIERFSEDIDLAMDRKFFGFEGDISKNKIKSLRKKSCDFISTIFLKDLVNKLTEWKAIDECKLTAQPIIDSDKDPQGIEVHYDSVLDKSDYLQQRVLIEVSPRSLMEPIENRNINSFLSATFLNHPFTTESFSIPTVLPQKTFLEKIFLLHEEFLKETSKIRIERLSRHLYDLERLMDTEHGKNAISNKELYNGIVAHREKFFRNIDYSKHVPSDIRIVPPDAVIEDWEKDYQTMIENMIYGNPLKFNPLIQRIQELQKRINEIS